MFPAVVVVDVEIDLNERPPLRALGLANQMQPRFERGAVGFARVARDAGTDDILPSRRAASVTRNDVVEIEIVAIKSLSAVLAGVLVPLENVVAGEFHLFFREPVEHDEEDDLGDAQPERDGVNALGMRFLLGKILPLTEIKGLERPAGI